MTDRSFELWRKCLLIVCVFMVLLGIGLVLFDNRVIGSWFTALLNKSVFGEPELPANVVTYHKFMHAVLGGTVAGWAVMMIFIVQHPFRRKERWAWWALLVGSTVWVVPDSGASLYYGAWPNAVLNACSYVALVVPLLFTRKAFGPGGTEPSAP